MSTMIQQIPGMAFSAAQPPASISGVKGPQDVQPSGDAAPARSRTPVTDEYVPEEKQEPAGLYWLGRDEDGQPKLYFDDPERAADGPEKPDGSQREAAGDKAERCTCSTDQVDREIETLKKDRQELEQQLRAETDGVKAKALEQKLAQVERELGQKDNDAYRRQHAVFS